MNGEFCTRTTRKIRKLGYAPNVAARYSRFMYLSMLSVSGIMAGLCGKGDFALCDETPVPAPRDLIVAPHRNTGPGIIDSGSRAVYERARSSRIHSI